jgi:iduronate 2-sulfatase
MSKFSRRQFLQSGALAAAGTALESSAATGMHGKKNVLFIAVDDQNTSLGCYGNSVVKSPNLDALAARGTRFAAAYCQYPLCGPSRASLMTGKAPDTTKIYDLQTPIRGTMPDVVSIGQLFRKNGYYSARVGKIYHADVPNDIGHDGLDDPATWDYVYDPAGVDHLKDEPLITNFTPQRVLIDDQGHPRLGSAISFYESPSPDRAMTDSLGADEAIRLLREKRNQPFFLAYGLYRPHVPWIVPKRYFDKYPLESIKARPFDPAELKLAPSAAYFTHPPNFGMDEQQCRKAIRAYYASTSFMDAQVGRVLSELKNLGLEKNTVVVFWADHGWSLGEHGQWEKQTVFETTAHVPLIFAGPGTGKKGQVCRSPVEHLDIYPTLADICGLEGTPGDLQGTSLARLLDDPAAETDRVAITQVTRPPAPEPGTIGYSIRTQQYRYTSWQGRVIGEELYDYEQDPLETRNLADDPNVRDLKGTLKERLSFITAQRGRSMELGKLTPASKG